jgi:hypothetical protein
VGSLFARYDKNGMVVGIRDQDTQRIDQATSIPITKGERIKLMADPDSYRVQDGKLVKIENSNLLSEEALFLQRKAEATKQVQNLTYKDRTYVADQQFQTNLLLASLIADKEQVYFWALVPTDTGQEWQFLPHNLSDIVALISILNKTREHVSLDLYKGNV